MYSKLYSSMYDGTLGTRGPWQALVTFQQLLVLSDRYGQVDMTREAISRRTTIPLDIIAAGISALEQPDPDSRRPDADGRRIVRLAEHRDWGWQIVNYEHYARIRSAEERRDYNRNKMREYRAKGAPAARKGNGAARPPISFPPLPEWVPADLWTSWFNAKPKRARTLKAHELGIKRLDELRAAGNDPTAILEHCIRSGYQGIFAPHTANGKHVSPPPNGAKCYYCPELATKITNDIPHCKRADHLDMAIARRQ